MSAVQLTITFILNIIPQNNLRAGILPMLTTRISYEKACGYELNALPTGFLLFSVTLCAGICNP